MDSGDAFQSTADPLRKPEPLTVRVNAGPPALAEVGESPEIDGIAALMVNIKALETVTPPFTTVMLAVPAATIMPAVTEAVNWLTLTKLVLRGDPFQSTVEVLANPEPLTVRVKAGPPAVAELGDMLDSDAVAAVMLRDNALETAPPGLTTVIIAAPALVMRLAGTVAVNWFAVT